MSRRVAAVAVAIAFASLGTSAGTAAGRKYALLIGVGSYTFLPRNSLEGPPHDVRTLQRVLTQDWGFDPRDVVVLLDRQATKAAILGALDRLASETRPSDYVFVYFSGHGTSGYDRTFKDVGIDGNSGALIPADFRPGPLSRLKESLIIGSRDLKPRLELLDKDRKLFVVFDSCFSGNAARMLFAVGDARYIPPGELVASQDSRALVHTEEDAGPQVPGQAEAPETPFPYRNLIYISAASKSEKAVDISSAALRSGRVRTVDDQPHGALTNALLEGLSGAADTNRDGRVSYGELYEYAKDRVSQSFPHQPQLLVPAVGREALLTAPVLGAAGPAVAPPPVAVVRPQAAAPPSAAPTAPGAPTAKLSVKLLEIAPAVAAKIAALPGVRLVSGSGPYDVLLTQGPLGFKLYHASGDELASYPIAESAAVVERVARQVAVQALVDLTYDDQDFNVTLDIPGNRGFLKEREPFFIDFSAETDAHVLLFDVDSGGSVSVLYPFSAGEARPVRRGRVPSAPDVLRVSPPYGTEYLKIVAFAEKPAGFDRWIEASFSASRPELVELLKMLRTARGRRAQARLKVVTRAAGS
ncbi:MAG TPA: caspase family protein [Vicinamibacteria bacterium]|nr:caspase family protein [Vicinamibacteria bacterium]